MAGGLYLVLVLEVRKRRVGADATGVELVLEGLIEVVLGETRALEERTAAWAVVVDIVDILQARTRSSITVSPVRYYSPPSPES